MQRSVIRFLNTAWGTQVKLNQNWPGTVYALADEAGLVWYVGQTRYTLNNRLKRHYVEARKGIERPVCRWIRERDEQSLPVNMLLIEQDALWDVAETKWIAHYRTINPLLLNVLDGGCGFKKGSKLSEETKQRMSEAKKAQWADPAYKARVKASIKAERNTPEAKKRLSDQQTAAWQKDEVREARISTRNVTVQGDEFREKMSKKATRQMADPAARQHLSKKQKERFADPAERDKSAEAAKRGWADPEKRAARIAAMKKARWPDAQQADDQ